MNLWPIGAIFAATNFVIFFIGGDTIEAVGWFIGTVLCLKFSGETVNRWYGGR